jgi:hypothetical protein
MDFNLRLFFYLGALFLSNITAAQDYYIVGEPVSDSIDTLNWSSLGECNAEGHPDFTLEFEDSEVTGLSFVFILTNVAPANTVYTNYAGVINTGDTLLLDGYDHSFYFPELSEIKGTFKIIGTPQVEGETYSCGDILWIHTLSHCFNTFKYYDDPDNDEECEVKPSCYTQQTDTVTVCDSYYWEADSATYTTSGIYSKMLRSTSGCDSLAKLDLTVNESFFTVDEVVSCAAYTWIDGNMYIVSDSTATYTTTTQEGCDSTVLLNLTIPDLPPTIDQVTSCQEFTWIDGNTYTNSNDTAIYILTSIDGCDSLIHLDLTITEELNTEIELIENNQNLTLIAVEDDKQYQWLDCNSNFSPIINETEQTFTLESSGSYAFLISDSICTDTSECLYVDITNLDEFENTIFDLFPNPNKGEFGINNKTGALTKLIIVDAVGKKVFSQRLESSHHKVQTDLPSGVYMVRFIQDNLVTTKRMIVK